MVLANIYNIKIEAFDFFVAKNEKKYFDLSELDICI